MSDRYQHPEGRDQDHQGGQLTPEMEKEIEALIGRHAEAVANLWDLTPEQTKELHELEPPSFTPKQLEHIFEQTRAALHLEGLDWSEASRLADRARTRVRGYK